jgi:hypothetical protein
MTPFQFGQKIASQPSMFGNYMHQFNKFYNPWSKAWNEPAKDGIEKGLQYAGRAAMGVGAGAGLAAGGLAAAPAVASAGNTAMATAGGLASTAGVSGQQLSRITNTASRLVPKAQQFTDKAMNTINKINYSPADIANDAYQLVGGNFSGIKGPAGIPGANLPFGAPSLPTPAQAAQGVTEFVGSLPGYFNRK